MKPKRTADRRAAADRRVKSRSGRRAIDANDEEREFRIKRVIAYLSKRKPE